MSGAKLRVHLMSVRASPAYQRWGLRVWLLVFSALLTTGQKLHKAMSEHQMRVIHTAMDLNRDGMVDLDEAKSLVRELRMSLQAQQSALIMKDLDANADGSLSLDEFRAALKTFQMHEGMDVDETFASFDSNQDDVLSTGEAGALFAWMFRFQKLDANDDGTLSQSEFQKVASPKLKGKSKEEVKKSREEGKRIFGKLDSDGNSRLSPAEFFEYEVGTFAAFEALAQLFEAADANGDARISEEELVQVRGNQKFLGTAAFHHLMDWIKRVEEAVQQAKSDL
eukprot:TRINITY_DN26549_c0_g1_i2.p1 TRINITY_DN26549_c0_g1~~TRINITY_DN26549_c0_g1_i2.p1  ORF type:complete len:309 (-),score=61.26 TRINITY_DN26549_c0_g1_i2:366-1208(-)